MTTRSRDLDHTGRDEAQRAGGRSGGVASIQRARMVAAMVDVAREHGLGQVTVAHVVARSGVSRRTFYELFEDRDACFLAAFDDAVARAAAYVLPAFEAGRNWRERVCGGLRALLEFLEDEPGLGELCVVEALGGGPVARTRRAQVVEALIDVVDAGRAETQGGASPTRLTVTRLTAEGVVGAVLAVLHARLCRVTADTAAAAGAGASHAGGTGAQSSTMEGLLGPLMGMIVLPYHGAAAAAREVAKPAPPRRRPIAPRGDPLRNLDMRLTYRTVRVLLTIATHPDASNREVSDAAGVSDQGQISKLLARLEHLGLVCNRGEGPQRGEPNAWRLTARGEEIERAVRGRAAPVDA